MSIIITLSRHTVHFPACFANHIRANFVQSQVQLIAFKALKIEHVDKVFAHSFVYNYDKLDKSVGLSMAKSLKSSFATTHPTCKFLASILTYVQQCLHFSGYHIQTLSLVYCFYHLQRKIIF